MSLESKFTYTWKIKNYSFCNEQIRSPEFSAENFNLNRCQLEFYPRGPVGDSEYISFAVYLYDKLRGELTIFESKMELINPNGEILSSKKIEKDTLDKDGFWFWREAMIFSTLINEMKHWTEDTLTIRCRFIGKQQRRQLEIECEATTKIGVDRCSMPWRMSNPDTSDWSERRFFSFSEQTPIIVTLYAPEEDVMIDITKEGKNSSYVTCRMSLVDVRGNEQYSQNAKYLFPYDEKDAWNFPTFFTKTILKINEVNLVVDDTFTLVCNFSATNGKNSNEIKYRTLPQMNASSSSDPISSLLSDLRDMFTNKIHADVEIRVDNEIFPAHKSHLAARSPVFSAMFDQDMLESQTGYVEISDIDAQTMNSFLEFVYTGTVSHMDYEIVSKLLIAADKYEVLSLKEKCASFLISVLSEENVCEIIVLADMVGQYQLKSSSLGFIKSHAGNISRSPQWSEWIKKNAELATQILCMLATDISYDYSSLRIKMS